MSSQMKNVKKCVDCTLIQQQKIQEEVICSICLQFMTNPYRVNCGANRAHVFGIHCIKQWITSNKKKQCPLCRGTFDQLSISPDLQENCKAYTAACPGCKQVFAATYVMNHTYTCKILQQALKDRLKSIVQHQKQYLELQINPHLREAHIEIYTQHVKDWCWLQSDVRDWKWWWWCNQPWWQNKACQKCNELWHKYEKEIDEIEMKRKQILSNLNMNDQKQ